jgi:hypothetical protein
LRPRRSPAVLSFLSPQNDRIVQCIDWAFAKLLM